MTTGSHIELEGDTATEIGVIVPDYVIESDVGFVHGEPPLYGVDFWHWCYGHFDD